MPAQELIAAAARVQADWMSSVARATGGHLWEVQGVLCIARGRELLIPFPTRLPGATLDRALQWREEHDGTVGCWAADEGAALAPQLAASGFEEGWRPHWMAIEPVAAGLDARISRAVEVPEWDAHGQALLTLAGDRTTVFVARTGERAELAGFAWLHAPEGESVAGVFDVVVFEGFRRRGLGRALTAAACAHAAGLGCGRVTLNATGDGERLYRAMGFASLGHGRTWWRHR